MSQHYDLYASLGLNREASCEELGAKLSARLETLRQEGAGPDSPQVDEVSTARAIFSDPQLRHIHDARLDDPEATPIDIPALHELAASGAGSQDESNEPAGSTAVPVSEAETTKVRVDDAPANKPGAYAEPEVKDHEAPRLGEQPEGAAHEADEDKAHEDHQNHEAPQFAQPGQAGPQAPNFQQFGQRGQQGPQFQQQNQQPQQLPKPPKQYKVRDADEPASTFKERLAQLPTLPKALVFTALGCAAVSLLMVLVTPFVAGSMAASLVESFNDEVGRSSDGLFELSRSDVAGFKEGARGIVMLLAQPLSFLLFTVIGFQALSIAHGVLRPRDEIHQWALVASSAFVAVGALVAALAMPVRIIWITLIVLVYAIALIVLLVLPDTRAWFQGKIREEIPQQQFQQPQNQFQAPQGQSGPQQPQQNQFQQPQPGQFPQSGPFQQPQQGQFPQGPQFGQPGEFGQPQQPQPGQFPQSGPFQQPQQGQFPQGPQFGQPQPGQFPQGPQGPQFPQGPQGQQNPGSAENR
ncbi:hypothetical protein [Corynebacterium frankenforstense]